MDNAALLQRRQRSKNKRLAGDGTFFQRSFARKDGSRYVRWVCEIVVPNRGHGIRKTFYGDTVAEVRSKRDAYKMQSDAERDRARDKTRFDVFLDRWLEETKRSNSLSTFRSYEWICRAFIKPLIGAKCLVSLDATDIENLLADLQKAQKSTRTIWGVYVILRAALNAAKKKKLIAENPIASVEPPCHRSKRMVPLTHKQVNRLLDAAKGDRLHALYVLAIYCGLRQGELFGLKWGDVNLRSKSIVVRGQVVEHSGSGPTFVGYTKTKKDRTVSLSPEALVALREHRARSIEQDDDANEFVFTATDGSLLRKSNFIRKSFHVLLAACNLRCRPKRTRGKVQALPIPCCDRHGRIRFHDLRHTAATLALSEGTNPMLVQKMLGHYSVAFTLDTYAGFVPTMQEQVAKNIQRALRR